MIGRCRLFATAAPPTGETCREYAVHFTNGVETLMKIPWRKIEPSEPLRAARNLVELEDTQKSAYFSEIPLDLLGRLTARSSHTESALPTRFPRREVVPGSGA